MAYYARMLGKGDVPAPPGDRAPGGGVGWRSASRSVAGRPPAVTADGGALPQSRHAYTVSRAREVLGWEPQVDLDEGMRRTEAWFRERGPAAVGSLACRRHVRHRRLRGRARSASRPRTRWQRMAAALGHRGPDDRGVEIVGNVGLVHTRLAIVDPSPAGHQPMVDGAGDWWLTYNGEVFNHLELRAS